MADYTQQINVRQVTDIHANWSEESSEEQSKFSFQLILDNGAQEYVIRPTAEDAKVLLKPIEASASMFFEVAGEQESLGKPRSVEYFVGAALEALDRPVRLTVVPGADNRVRATVVRLLPRHAVVPASRRLMTPPSQRAMGR